MNTSNIHSTLTDNVPYINKRLNNISAGGCGLFALEMYKALKRRNISCTIVLVDRSYSSADVTNLINRTGCKGINSAYRYLIKRFNQDGIRLPDMHNGHLCVKFSGRLYDNNGVYQGKAISKHITSGTMSQFLSAPCWNNTFKYTNNNDRDITGTLIEFLEKVFSENIVLH